MKDSVTVLLTREQALVLFERFARFQNVRHPRIANNAELIALSEVSAQLQSTLIEPFQESFPELLAAARARLALGLEGLAPGVEP